jgi:Tetracyclin repressor-like, C-terminal domain
VAIAAAYRACALAHPHLYRLMTYQPLRRDLLPAGLEAQAAQPFAEAAGYDVARARAMWASAHGLARRAGGIHSVIRHSGLPGQDQPRPAETGHRRRNVTRDA